MNFPTIVYKGFGQHSRQGGTFDCLPVVNEEEMIEAKKAGWSETLPEAIAAYDKEKPVVASPKKAGWNK